MARRIIRLMAAALPILVVLLLLAIDAWIYVDANAHSERGTPVVFSAGSLRISTPAAWFAACLFFSVVFIPVYMVSR
jgi:hypothetical protein